MNRSYSDLEAFAQAHQQELEALVKELAVIPAPSHHEKARADKCLSWLQARVNAPSFIDEAHNVICEIGDTAEKPIVLLMAHTDIVFDDTVPLAVTEKDGKWYCPGIGDDTAHVAMLLLCAAYTASRPSAREVALVFAANTGEEGEGNLKGCKTLMARYGERVREMITFDGYLDTINDTAVGSKRFRIAVDVTGGHSFRDFGADNAIAVMSELVAALNRIPLPREPITTFNFGHIEGGSTVNSIAEHCELLYEFRADRADNLRYMTEQAEQILARFSKQYRVTVTPIGTRPCAEGVDPLHQQALVSRAEAAFEGLPTPGRYPASTDCNIPLSMGIPAVCLGFIRGGGAHTREEYLEAASLADGFRAALRFVASYNE